MNNLTFVFLAALIFVAGIASAEVRVLNVEAWQQDFPSKIVEITYDVEANVDRVDITLEMSMDGGDSWDIPVRSVEGDVGMDVEVGDGKLILWDAGRDYPNQINDQMRASVNAETEDFGGNDEFEPGEERVFELIDGLEITMIWIPAGSFMMGSEEGELMLPVHRVTFENGFWIGKYEVTQALLYPVMGYGNAPAPNFPAININWDEIQEFERNINDGFRLPSEAEWEYACGAGHYETRFWFGDVYADLNDHGWLNTNSEGHTHEVGQKEPNPWGLYDMYGNVWEACEDLYNLNYEGAPDDGSPWYEGNEGLRTIRGGCWGSPPRECPTAFRMGWEMGRNNAFGFRLAKSNN